MVLRWRLTRETRPGGPGSAASAQTTSSQVRIRRATPPCASRYARSFLSLEPKPATTDQPLSQPPAAQVGKGALHFWSFGKEQPALRCFPAEPLSALAASPDGAFCAGGTATGAIYLWETAAGRLLRVWPAHHKAITAAAFVCDGSFLATASEDTLVAVWSIAGASKRQRPPSLSFFSLTR